MIEYLPSLFAHPILRTAVTGALFLVLLVIWREQSRSERDRHRLLMRSAHGDLPRGRVTTGDGGGHDDAGMRRAQNHKSRSGRRSKRRRRRPTHTRPSTRASWE